MDAPDPLKGRDRRLDEARTAALVRLLVADPAARRVFIELHPKARLGLTGLARVRSEACRAARHDDPIHVDFHRPRPIDTYQVGGHDLRAP